MDLDLAKLNANKPEDNTELRKKLWLRIARYVIKEEKDNVKKFVYVYIYNIVIVIVIIIVIVVYLCLSQTKYHRTDVIEL